MASVLAALCLGCIGAAADTAATCKQIAVTEGRAVELSQPGRYCLAADLSWRPAGAAVRITASDVTLDLAGRAIVGDAHVKDQVGVQVASGVKGIEIGNGAIRLMQIGIRAVQVNQLTIKVVDFTDISWIGTHLSGRDHVVERSRFANLGGVLYDDGGEGDGYSVGILADSVALTIRNNTFHNVNRQPVDPAWTGEGVAILLSDGSSNVRILDNTFSVDQVKTPDTIGLWSRASNVTLESNRFDNVERPIEGAYDGTTTLVDNQFGYGMQTKVMGKASGPTMRRAVALAVKPMSELTFKSNRFRGYHCPIQLFGQIEATHLVLGDNQASFPQGRRTCPGTGTWYAPLVFKTSQPQNRS